MQLGLDLLLLHKGRSLDACRVFAHSCTIDCINTEQQPDVSLCVL